MRGRPDLYIRYKDENAIFKNNFQKISFLLFIIGIFYVGIIVDDYWILLLSSAIFISIATWGINIVSGYAGQISLAHGFFVGVGTYTAAIIGGVATDRVIGLGLDMAVWLPLAGLVSALFGIAISPLAVRLKGLNLALVTIGIVYIGAYLFSKFKSITGGSGIGRKTAELILFGINFEDGLYIGDYYLSRFKLVYFLGLIITIFMGLGMKNIARSKIGRAYASIRDRDIAAEAIGINLSRYKTSAFALSSFYAGIAGALLFASNGGVDVETFGLYYSITFVAILIIGGVGTVLGPLFGALFFAVLPGLIQLAVDNSEFIRSSIPLSVAEIERMIFGLLIIGFLVFEPRGIWGIWFRLRNYFKAWPFSY
ncbi:MAG: branched-chain amino acid ABC transporter permease [Rhodobiaceae bacterium]|nr:branched-chain amino acid ABC transporter permease [Rhodobiaceae bacterium]